MSGAVSFAELGVAPWLLKTLNSLKLQNATPVQSAVIPHVLKGEDVIACAETGSGKTLAFALPILQRLGSDPYGISTLVLTPARELALQIAEQFRAVGVGMNVHVALVIGGVRTLEQSIELAKKPHVVVATPGRMAELLRQNVLRLDKLSFLVLDEADRMLNDGFESDLHVIFGATPAKRQTLLFSATMSSTLEELQSVSMRAPFRWDQRAAEREQLAKEKKKNKKQKTEGNEEEEDDDDGKALDRLVTVKTLRQTYMLVPEEARDAYLVWLIRSHCAVQSVSTVVFCSTVQECAVVHRMLQSLVDDVRCVSLHSLMTQSDRVEALTAFRGGFARLLVATDVASRGLDIPLTDLVVNASCPAEASTYVHRVGRTARSGRKGVAVTLVSQTEVELLLHIEDRIGLKLQEFEHEEDEVLKFLREAKAARHLAQMWWEEQGLATKDETRKERIRKKNLRRKQKKRGERK